MNKFNQKGFSLVEGLLVVIALSLVVGVGFYVYKSVNDTKSSQSSSQATDQEAKKEETKVAPSKSDKELIIDALAKYCAEPNPNTGAKLNEAKVRETISGAASNLILEGDFATMEISCIESGTQTAGVGGVQAWLHKTNSWEIINVGLQDPNCNLFDGKKAPKSVVPKCWDSAINDTRAPN